jgi:hypothetical protein
MRVLIAFTIICAAGGVLLAQQPAIVPAPRTAAGTPDLTGVYQPSSRRGTAWDADSPGEQPGVAAPRPRGDAIPIPGGREPIPFQDWARAKAQEFLNRRAIDDPATYCQLQSSVRTTPVGLFPIEFVQTPAKLVIMYEYFGEFRAIPIDGRGHPADVEPTFMGDPVGKWDGDTLVVDVTNFKDGGWLGAGVFHSDQLHLTERYTRIDRDQLNYEAVIEDPKVFTKPWTVRATLMLRDGTRLREYSCIENNLDVQRYQEYLKQPSLFTRTPPAAPAAR